MPFIKSIPVDKGMLAVWQIAEPVEELLSLFNPSVETSQAFKQFSFEKRKSEWLATRCLLKQMIGSEFSISYTSSGKPLLHHPIYQHISISHSRDFVAVYIHPDQRVGIDIESMNRNYAPIAKRYLSELELMAVKEDTWLQCIYWCAKEAIFKVADDQGIDFRKQIEVMAFDPDRDFFPARYISADSETIYRLQYQTFDNHCLVWVCDAPLEPLNL